jgi:hypothetical protein
VSIVTTAWKALKLLLYDTEYHNEIDIKIKRLEYNDYKELLTIHTEQHNEDKQDNKQGNETQKHHMKIPQTSKEDLVAESSEIKHSQSKTRSVHSHQSTPVSQTRERSLKMKLVTRCIYYDLGSHREQDTGR